MPESSIPNPELVVIRTEIPFYSSPKFYLLGILIFVIFFGIGFFTPRLSLFSNFIPNKDLKDDKSISDTASLKILQNPTLSNWSGRINGVVVEKEKNYFSLAKDKSNIIKVYYTPKVTFFKANQLYPKNTVATKSATYKTEDVPYEKIKLGDLLDGSFSVLNTKDNFIVIGKNLSLQKQ